MTTLPVLRAGMRAVYDTFAGLVPVKVDRITGTSGPCGSDQQVECTVTEDVGALLCPAYRKGEKVSVWGLHVAPRAALRRTQFETRIGPYNVEVTHAE